MNFTITSDQIMGFFGFAAAAWAFYKIIVELKKPSENLKEQVEKHEEKLQNDDERLKEIEQTDKLILQSLLVLINHDITGNGIEQLKVARDEINKFLINK